MNFARADNLELQVVKESGGIALVELKGRVDSTNAKDLDAVLSSLIDDGISKIILSCASLRYVSSAGLSIFLKTFREVSKQDNGHFLLCSAAENIKRVLNITGFSDFIPVYGDLQQARQQLEKEEK